MARHKPDAPLVETPDHRGVEYFSVPSQLLRQAQTLRLDASYFNPAVAHALETLRHSGMKLKSLCDITTKVFIPPRFKRIYVGREYGIPFLQGSHIVHFQPADVKYLSVTAHKQLDRWIIHKGWLLVTCSGTVGRVGICPEEWDGWAASQHILRIIPNEKECPSGYLYSFLTSPLGHVQLTKHIYGAVVDELTEDQTQSVLVPLPVNDEQRKLVTQIDSEARAAVVTRSQAVALIAGAVEGVASLVHFERKDAAIAAMMASESPASQAQDVPWNRLDRAFRAVLTVPKDALLKDEAKAKRSRARKRARSRARRAKARA